MPTLIIAANLPDIDAVATLLGGHEHLAIRRGITHGPIALVLLPILLCAAMIWFDRWQAKRGTRPEKRLPIHRGWLLVLAYIGTISHPALDWLNVYGIRLLEPFTSQWFYGDTLFIIDIWVWAALGIGVWLSRRRERGGQGNWQRPAWISFTAVCAYIFANGGITGTAEADAMTKLRTRHNPTASMPDPIVVASPVPIEFWRREILWRDGPDYGAGEFTLMNGLSLATKGRAHGADPLTLSKLKLTGEQASAYLFWSRMPIVQKNTKGEVSVSDQRFLDPRVGDRFTLKVIADGKPEK